MLRRLFIYLAMGAVFASCTDVMAFESDFRKQYMERCHDRHICDSLANAGIVRHGQTRRNVRKAWGEPDEKSVVSLYVGNKHLTIWIYRDRNYAVEFINGRVVGKTPVFKEGMYFDKNKKTYVRGR